MTEAASTNDLPQTALEEKFAALEAKFAGLEKKYHSLHERPFTLSENSTGKATEISIAQLPSANATSGKKDSSKEKEIGPKSRAKIIISRADPRTGGREDSLLHDPSPTTSPLRDTSHAFTLRKNLYAMIAEKNNGEIDIINPDLWDLLKGLLGHYPYHIFQGPPVTLESPYVPLVRYWEKLEQASEGKPKNDNDKQARSDLKLLLDTISTSSGDLKLDKYFKTRHFNEEQKAVTFESLWTIFTPGSLVYGKVFQEEDQVFIVLDSVMSWPNFQDHVLREKTFWKLSCWTYDWDGKKFKRRCLDLKFEHFDGHKPITSLPYYPFELNKQHAAIRNNLIEQGRKYKEFCTAIQGSRLFEYVGEAIFVQKGFSGVQGDNNQDEDRMLGLAYQSNILRSLLASSSSDSRGPPTKSTSIGSRVMVDFESYFRYGPSFASVGSLRLNSDSGECGCNDCRGNIAMQAGYRSTFDDDKHQTEWDDEQYMLCPPRVLGYSLRDKQWAQLQVSVLKIIPDYDVNNSWNTRLKLADGEKTKDMILELVKGHENSAPSQNEGLEVDDVVARKGKGLVILLYGPPGVGKTLTAETVAIAARKPLFAISVADVGTKAKNAESNLAKIFALATSWQAILLISVSFSSSNDLKKGSYLIRYSDEADVFLESRGKGMTTNTERNALVSVFLRVLEYYQGILMLTTNQIAQFDVAVQSRIHVAIKYVHLSEKQTMDIFKGFLEPLADQGLVKDMDGIREWLEEDVVKIGLDGRQIRNIVTSALSLARVQKKGRLEKNHLKKILNNVKDFKIEFIKQFEVYKNEQGMNG